jgi:hypothetical protein
MLRAAVTYQGRWIPLALSHKFCTGRLITPSMGLPGNLWWNKLHAIFLGTHNTPSWLADGKVPIVNQLQLHVALQSVESKPHCSWRP